MVVVGAAFSSFWLGVYPLPPIFGVGESIFGFHVGLWFDGMMWELLIFRPDVCCGCLAIDTLAWQVGNSGSQGQVRSISAGIGAVLLLCVCVNVSQKTQDIKTNGSRAIVDHIPTVQCSLSET